MALSCRLFARQANLSLRYILQNSQASRITVNKNHNGNCCKSVRISHSQPFQINARGFRSRNASTESTKVVPKEPQGNSVSLFKSTLFVSGVCSCSFLGAMIWNYENVRKVYKGMSADQPQQDNFYDKKAFGFRQHISTIWKNLDPGTRFTVGIIAANVAVWALWRVPRWQQGMVRYFSSSAAHPRASMVLSAFSHISLLHLIVNMYVLLSFAPHITRLFGVEQFSAFYLSAGTVSSFASIVCNRLLKRPYSVSVGASGAIMGLLGVTAMVFPQAQLQVAFVSEIFPHSFSAESGVKAIILFDVIGLLMGWKVLDHAGHLGGMLCGVLYAKYGSKLIWGNREPVVKMWHDIRGKP